MESQGHLLAWAYPLGVRIVLLIEQSSDPDLTACR